MSKRILKDVVQFLGLVCLLATGVFSFYMAMVAYQLYQIENQNNPPPSPPPVHNQLLPKHRKAITT
ncbi:hypothetical protein NWP17_15120 [Chrysosporum bergii ANA360D]|jgi:hypothetical protein|uniref:Uncharacterized protein n=1 Tax=Chrysosporum bergii ANA360D TaxID=617107 RepID=A0AA43GU66_9CYAN|nr:hypothetical protein [Chrysosporum bergii]MDH6061748.1 hypothetical protein [Chrysosporum bergii ANA360D]